MNNKKCIVVECSNVTSPENNLCPQCCEFLKTGTENNSNAFKLVDAHTGNKIIQNKANSKGMEIFKRTLIKTLLYKISLFRKTIEGFNTIGNEEKTKYLINDMLELEDSLLTYEGEQ